MAHSEPVRDSDAALHNPPSAIYSNKELQVNPPSAIYNVKELQVDPTSDTPPSIGDDDEGVQDVEKDLESRGAAVPAQTKNEKDPNLVEFDGPDDPGNPMNWSRTKKWTVTLVMAFLTFVITFASSVFSTATYVTALEFGVSDEVMTLGTSLFVLVRSAPASVERKKKRFDAL